MIDEIYVKEMNLWFASIQNTIDNHDRNILSEKDNIEFSENQIKITTQMKQICEERLDKGLKEFEQYKIDNA